MNPDAVFTKKMNDAVASYSKAGDGEWGHLAQFAELAALEHLHGDGYKQLSFDDAMKLTKLTHAAHCMLYAPWNEQVFELYAPRAALLMQLRFDGYLGFPGGLVDGDETPIEAVNREMKEEMNFDTSKHSVAVRHHVVSHVNEAMGFVAHFYALPVPFPDFLDVERVCLTADDYGKEVLGILRPPLYTMGDHYRGFPAFLDHNFIGNSREQLLESLVKCNIMSKDEIQIALNKSRHRDKK